MNQYSFPASSLASVILLTLAILTVGKMTSQNSSNLYFPDG